MNVVDYAVLGIVAISLLFGLYKGFIRSVLALAGLFVAMWAAYVFAPMLVDWVTSNDLIVNNLKYYTDTALRMGDSQTANTLVAGLSQAQIVSIVAQADLPSPFNMLLESNMINRVYEALLPQATVSEYLSQTVVSVIIHIVSYIAVFLASYFVVTLFVNLIHYIFRFPVLRSFDVLLGGVFGIARGVFMAYILFALVPIFITVLPFPQFAQMVEESQFGSIIINSSVIQTIMNGHL